MMLDEDPTLTNAVTRVIRPEDRQIGTAELRVIRGLTQEDLIEERDRLRQEVARLRARIRELEAKLNA
jgi:ubiquinone biosynthesis protein UbiJ